MDLSKLLFTLLLAAVGIGRLIEMGVSRRRQRALLARGVAKEPERHFRWMVLLHSGLLLCAALEVWLLDRPFVPLLALPAGLLFVLANLLRWWVIYTMREHWNVQVMRSTSLGVISDGPYRWIRHPNYVAVFVELLALPLIHSAWLTALLGTLAHIWVLYQRITLEEQVLLSDPAYRAAMGDKPRFVPRIPGQ